MGNIYILGLLTYPLHPHVGHKATYFGIGATVYSTDRHCLHVRVLKWLQCVLPKSVTSHENKGLLLYINNL